MLTFSVVPVLGYLYFEDHGSSVPSVDSDIMKGGLSLGMIVGQILFGLLGDACGRHAVYGKELIITLCGTMLVILLPWKGMSVEGIVAWISVFRVLTGVGIGAGMLVPVPSRRTFLSKHCRLPHVIRFVSRKSCIGFSRRPGPVRVRLDRRGKLHSQHRIRRAPPRLQVRRIPRHPCAGMGVEIAARHWNDPRRLDPIRSLDPGRDWSIPAVYDTSPECAE